MRANPSPGGAGLRPAPRLLPPRPRPRPPRGVLFAVSAAGGGAAARLPRAGMFALRRSPAARGVLAGERYADVRLHEVD